MKNLEIFDLNTEKSPFKKNKIIKKILVMIFNQEQLNLYLKTNLMLKTAIIKLEFINVII